MFKVVIAALFALFSTAAFAQQNYVAGKDYAVIETPVRTSDPAKIEVTEVFWYGCPHCNTFRPLFAQWEKQLPEDVVATHSPAMWRGNMRIHAQIFYTAQALNLLDKMHKEIFDAYHIAKKKLVNEKEIYQLFAVHGVDEETFKKTFNSFGVRSQVQQADARARGYGITGTPEVVVNGKYRTSASMAGGHERMLKVADFLIQQERAAMAK